MFKIFVFFKTDSFNFCSGILCSGYGSAVHVQVDRPHGGKAREGRLPHVQQLRAEGRVGQQVRWLILLHEI